MGSSLVPKYRLFHHMINHRDVENLIIFQYTSLYKGHINSKDIKLAQLPEVRHTRLPKLSLFRHKVKTNVLRLLDNCLYLEIRFE